MPEKPGNLHNCVKNENCEYCKKFTHSEMSRLLREGGIDPLSAMVEPGLMIEKVTGFNTAKILADRYFDYATLPEEQVKLLLSMIERRTKRHEPLQYILGEWGFMGHMFNVGEGCLCPRPDTELLCEYAISNIPENGTFADLCSGSGCIAVSVLLERSDIRSACAAELSSDAMKYLRQNAEKHGVLDRLEIISADVTERIFADGRKFDMILSNPPYIPTGDIAGLDAEVQFEPVLALDGGLDGLDIIRKIVEIYPEHVKGSGKIAIEFGFDQSGAVGEIVAGYGYKYEILKDYGGNYRTVVVSV